MFESKNEIPNYQSLMLPVLQSVSEGPRKISEVVSQISDELGLTDEQRALLLPSGKQTVIANRVNWAKSYLKHAGLVHNTGRGIFEITPDCRGVLAANTPEVNVKFLEKFEKFQEFRQRARQRTHKTRSTV